MYSFEELDEITRKWMLEEFLKEENSGRPFRSTRLSSTGLKIFPMLMKEAIQNGNEESLALSLSNHAYWVLSEEYTRNDKTYSRKIDPSKASEVLAYTEFNTWYVRGFARRLIEEGVEYCQIYRAAPAWEPRDECLEHEGKTNKVKQIYEGHRVRYWSQPINPYALSIPVGPYCHHTIRRK